MESSASMASPDPQDVPRVVASTAYLGAASPGADAPGAEAPRFGAVWRHEAPGRGLDANVIHLPPGEAIDPHDGPALDVLWHVAHGSGTLTTAGGETDLAAGDVVHLPRGSVRGVRAGVSGLTYLTVHARKPGLSLGPTR